MLSRTYKSNKMLCSLDNIWDSRSKDILQICFTMGRSHIEYLLKRSMGTHPMTLDHWTEGSAKNGTKKRSILLIYERLHLGVYQPGQKLTWTSTTAPMTATILPSLRLAAAAGAAAAAYSRLSEILLPIRNPALINLQAGASYNRALNDRQEFVSHYFGSTLRAVEMSILSRLPSMIRPIKSIKRLIFMIKHQIATKRNFRQLASPLHSCCNVDITR